MSPRSAEFMAASFDAERASEALATAKRFVEAAMRTITG